MNFKLYTFSHHLYSLKTRSGSENGALVRLSGILKRAGLVPELALLSVSLPPASHNDEEHSFDVFIHTAFVYMFTISGRAHHVKRHCCGSVHKNNNNKNPGQWNRVKQNK